MIQTPCNTSSTFKLCCRKFLEAASKYCDLSQQTFGGQICEASATACFWVLSHQIMVNDKTDKVS